MDVFGRYTPLPEAYDEFFDTQLTPRPEARAVVERLRELGPEELGVRQGLASSAFLQRGVTFSVYSDNQGSERIFPFDLIPRIIDGPTWTRIEAGLKQRVNALNAFLTDIYGPQSILSEGIVPKELVLGSSGYNPQCKDLPVPGGVRIHVAGIDLIRNRDGEFVVLEDNVRIPSGVSYVLENRAMMKRLMPRIFAQSPVAAVDQYPGELRRVMSEVSPGPGVAVVLTPGAFNSAYFEHSFLARRMGCALVQGSDLFVHDDRVFVKTVAGPQQVSVIYRRVDDAFLDPECFNPQSLLGVRGLMRAYRAGTVALLNAPGNGVVDDKAIYPYVPDMIRFYLSEEPILGQVQTYVCARPHECHEVLSRLDELVVKAVDGAGGYGMLVGPTSTAEERQAYAAGVRENPGRYIAQPVVDFSTCPTLCDGLPAPRRVDLRPFVLTGKDVWVLPGGLSRVALVEGSYVVNSSQGGGSKDTWVLRS